MTAFPHRAGGRHELPAAASALAAALQARGHDAHPHPSEPAGVEIRAVHITGWRYPDGHWEFCDEPVHITADPDSPGEPSWWLIDRHRELAVPRYGSPAAVAEWLCYELPAPDHPTTRLEHHPDFIDAESGAIPLDWYDAWEALAAKKSSRSPESTDPATVRIEATCCPGLDIAARTASTNPDVDRGGSNEFVLIYTPAKLPLAAARTRDSLHDLAARLAWFDHRSVHPGYLADTAHADCGTSVAHILEHWRSESAPGGGRRILFTTP